MNVFRNAALATLLALSLGAYATETAAAAVKISTCTTITKTGLHVLTKNIQAAGNCLIVAQDGVTIDFQGFVISGDGSGSGVSDSGLHKGITVRDGTLTNFLIGVDLVGRDGVIVKRMRVIGNNDSGIIAGHGSIVDGNIALSNGDVGILAGIGSIISNNTAYLNGGNGIESGSGSTVSGNTVRSNMGTGIEVVCPAHVIGNTAVFNTILPGIVELFPGSCILEHNLVHP